MGISVNEATSLLLQGKQLSWQKYKGSKAGSITLGGAGQRRLLEFLLNEDSSKVAEGNEQLFDGLVKAWESKDHDPAQNPTEAGSKTSTQSWRLDHLEASGFGGLTTFGGKPFDLYIGGSNWCLEGQNGSGKTSLVSAILWALTGKRIREHEGPIDERGEREPVEDDEGKKVGTWPPLAAYPTTVAELGKQAEVWVRLTFKAKNGDTAFAFRRIVSPPTGTPQHEEELDGRLKAALRLVEIGVLMPARLPNIGFGKSSVSLYEAVRQLTGLDQLSDIATGCSAFSAANRRFMKYAKDRNIEGYEQRFADQLSRAKQLADEYGFDLPSSIALRDKDVGVKLKEAASKASKCAGEYLETLKCDIPSSIDTATSEGRAEVREAVAAARGVVSQGPKAVVLFQVWRALTDAGSDEGFSELPGVLASAKAELTNGLEWHERQLADGKLRLKAIAAQSFIPVTNGDPDCPLCVSPLDDEKKRALAAELEELKENAAAAERKIGDVCRSIQESIVEKVPTFILENRTVIDTMDPAVSYAAAMNERFVTDQPFSDVLIGLASSAKAVIETQAAKLPHFEYAEFVPTANEPEPVTNLRHEVHALERLFELVGWWKLNRHTFVDAWECLIGKKGGDGSSSSSSIEGKLAALELALAHARPLDDLSRNLTGAATEWEAWRQIYEVQRTREAIANALEPLKDLRFLVAAETARSIAELSGTINAICERISLKERLSYEEAVVGRKEVGVTGSFSPGMRIDAAQVANTSWMRAILWSFVFALREETLTAMGFNPLPLVVLDDPQGTFDPRNKRRWAQELVRSANLPTDKLLGTQLILITHERSFYQMMIDHEKFVAQQGLIGGVNKVSGVATVANGGELQRLYDEADAANDDAKARDYIRKVRIYCEDLLKFMLRSVSKGIADKTLGQLREELRRLSNDHVAPFDRKAFQALISALNESQKAVKYINDTHHKDDESLGVAEAEVVKDYWDQTLLDKIHTAFGVFDTFELFAGEPRTFPWAKSVVDFPDGHKDRIKSLEMQQSGIAVAAKTDGRAGDGVLTIQEWGVGEKVFLPNHEIFQLAAGTLDPVAGVGDLIIVSNYAPVRCRNLVVSASGNTLLARRYNVPEDHSEIVVLTGQTVDPLALSQPVIVQPDTEFRKIVGTLFAAHLLPVPALNAEQEFIEVSDPNVINAMLKGTRLLLVEGRSAEPIALEGQFLITRDKSTPSDSFDSLDGRLVVAFDEDGARYFKRLRCHGKVVVLESLNPDGQTPAEVMSLDGSESLPRITEALEVVGVLFDLPNAKET